MILRSTIGCLAALATLTICRTTAADVAFVWLKDGRMLAGEVDPRTDQERLWLSSSGTAFALATSVAWGNVEAANIGGQQLQPDELQARAKDLTQRPISVETPEPRNAASSPIARLPRPIVRGHAAPRVVSIDVEARVANWDRDAEADGIEVRICPRNDFGQLVPVSGQLIVELVARSRLPLDNPDAFPRLGRWSLRVDADDFTDGAVYQLPYPNARAATDLTLERHGLVKATLLVFGQGRFEAATPTYLRRFNPVHDDLLRRAAVRER